MREWLDKRERPDPVGRTQTTRFAGRQRVRAKFASPSHEASAEAEVEVSVTCTGLTPDQVVEFGSAVGDSVREMRVAMDEANLEYDHQLTKIDRERRSWPERFEALRPENRED